MAFSCLIHFSSVPPQCVMLWWSREKFFLGITEMLSCNAMAPALSGGHCVTYCNRWNVLAVYNTTIQLISWPSFAKLYENFFVQLLAYSTIPSIFYYVWWKNPKKFLVQKNFWAKQFFGQKFFWSKKKLWVTKAFGSKKILGQKNFGSKNFWVKKVFVGQKKF